MNCKKLNICPKIVMVLDKDLVDYATVVNSVCAKCKEYEEQILDFSI